MLKITHETHFEMYGIQLPIRSFYKKKLTYSHKRILAIHERQPFRFRTNEEWAGLAHISKEKFEMLLSELVEWGFYNATFFANSHEQNMSIFVNCYK